MTEPSDVQTVLLAVTRLEGKLDGVTILHAQEIAQHGREINEIRKRQQDYAEKTDERLALVETSQAIARELSGKDDAVRNRVPVWWGVGIGAAATASSWVAVYFASH